MDKKELFCIIDSDIEEVVRLVNNRIFGEALAKLQELLNTRVNSATVHYLTAYCLHTFKIDYTNALNHYDLALQYGYDEFWLLYARGSLYYLLRNFEKARFDLERATKLNHDHVMAHKISQFMEEIKFAEAQELIYKRSFGEALDKLKALLETSPKSGRFHYFTGLCLNLKTDYKKALKHYDLALQYGYDEFRVRRSRSYLYRALNNFEAALADLERARSIDPHDQGAKEALSTLRTLCSSRQGDDQSIVPAPVLVTSVPKSGTMLLYNILISILGDQLVLPATIFDIEPFRTEYFERTSEIPNRVYWGHVSYSEQLARRLSSTPKIVLIRDPRDNAVSLAHFLDSTLLNQCTKREYEQYWHTRTWEDKLSGVIFGMDIPNYYVNPVMNFFLDYAIKWAYEPKTFFVRYEDIIGSKFGGNDAKVINTVKSLMEFIGVKNIDERTLAKKIAIGADPDKSTTFRSGGVGRWRHEFTPCHVKQLKIAAPGLVSSLGYEPDEHWDIDRIIYTTTFPKIDVETLTKLASKSITLDWNTYLELRKELLVGLTESNHHHHPFDEWALNIFNDSQQIENALSILENHLVVSVPDSPRWNYQYAFYLHILKKDLQKALYHYNIAYQNGFDEFWVRYNRGILLKELGDVDNARIDIKQAAQLNPQFEAAHEILRELEGETITSRRSEQLGLSDLDKVRNLIDVNLEYQKASLQLQEMLKKFPTDAQLNYLYGFCLHVLNKDIDKAIYSYNLALQNGFDEFWIKYNRGSLLCSMGDIQGSIADLEHAIMLKPDHKGALETLAHVRKILEKNPAK